MNSNHVLIKKFGLMVKVFYLDHKIMYSNLGESKFSILKSSLFITIFFSLNINYIVTKKFVTNMIFSDNKI